MRTNGRTFLATLLAAVVAIGAAASSRGQMATATQESARAMQENAPATQATQPRRGGGWAQPQVDVEQTKRARSLLQVLTPIAERVRRSVGVVVIDGRDVALATVVQGNGYLVTKASELTAESFEVRLADGASPRPGRVVGVVQEHDLALIQVDAANLAPVEWADPASVRVGQMVVAVGESREPLGMGVVSVGRRGTTGGFLGVSLMQTDAGIRVEAVTPGRPAEQAGIRPGDIIVAVNDERFTEREELSRYLQLQQAGTEVSVTVRRGEEELILRATLAQRPLEQSQRAVMQNSMGSVLSSRRSDFPVILQHDTVLNRNQQGGPLVDLDGRAIGVNIARAGRVETYALPVEVVLGLMPELMSGKYPSTTRPVEEVAAERQRELERALAELSRELDEAAARLDAARKASEGAQAQIRDAEKLAREQVEAARKRLEVLGPEKAEAVRQAIEALEARIKAGG